LGVSKLETLDTVLSYGVVCVILRLAVLVQYWRVTDGLADRRTHDESIYRSSTATRCNDDDDD